MIKKIFILILVLFLANLISATQFPLHISPDNRSLLDAKQPAILD